MEITLWLDYACPYCYVDFTRLHEVIKDSELSNIKINLHAAQIDKDAPQRAEDTTGNLLAKQENLSKAEVDKRFESIKKLGESANLDIKYADTLNTNTMDAHRLVQWVEHDKKDNEKAIKLANLLFKAYFTENRELANHEVLIDRAVKVGLDHDEVEKFLNTNEYRDLVIEQENILSDKGINSVPFMIINGKEFKDVQESETLKRIINSAYYKQA